MDTLCNRYAASWKQKERSCLSGRRRNYRNDRRALQGQAVVRWNIERKKKKKEMQDEMSESQESSRKSRLFITFGKGNLKEKKFGILASEY